jgi:type I restriction enzyme S subunit
VVEQYAPFFETQKRGATIKGIPSELVKSVKIPHAPISLQKSFASFVHQSDKSKFEIQQSLEKLETLKKSLMQQYFG